MSQLARERENILHHYATEKSRETAEIPLEEVDPDSVCIFSLSIGRAGMGENQNKWYKGASRCSRG